MSIRPASTDTQPVALEVDDPAIEFVDHALVLLVGEAFVATRVGGGLLPE
jgi:hypothetical protein